MRIGVIGCGGMGTTHYLSLKVLSEKEDDVEVVALSDCRKEFLDKAASYFPEAAIFFATIGISNAPGTHARSMSSSFTP